MIRKILCIGVLAATPAAGLGQDMSRPTAAGSSAGWPASYTCSVTPTTSRNAISTTGTGTGVADRAAPGRPANFDPIIIDLGISAPAGAIVPTVTAHAINTKGTGTSGRMLNARPDATVVISCTSANARARSALLPSADAAGWSCSVSGTDERPIFTIGFAPVPNRAADYRISIAERRGTHAAASYIPCAAGPGMMRMWDMQR